MLVLLLVLGGKGEPLGRMVVSGAAPDWAPVREVASIFCCRMAWTTQIGRALGLFRGGHGLAGGCDCVRMGLSRCQCNALPAHRASDHWRRGGDQTTARAQTHQDAPGGHPRRFPGLSSSPPRLFLCFAESLARTVWLPRFPYGCMPCHVCMEACMNERMRVSVQRGKREGEQRVAQPEASCCC
ncbi:hypothetical protein J3F83DRAFT_289287 [Trichoderma novae-zelandiae]